MELRRFTYIVLMAAFVGSLAFSSCKNGTGGQTTTNDSLSSGKRDSADWALWGDSCHKLHVKATEYFNLSQTDSLEAFVPEALKTCLEHGHLERYYNIWGLLAEEYVWDDEFDKAVAEVQRIQEDATKRHDDFGLFMAYKVLANGYNYSQNYEEAVKYYRKAIDHFHSKDITAMTDLFNQLASSLERLERDETLDSVLTEWKAMIDKNHNTDDSKSHAVWCHSNQSYQIRRADALIKRSQYEAAAEALDSSEYYWRNGARIELDYYTMILGTKCRLAICTEDYNTALDYCQQELDWTAENGSNSSLLSAMEDKVMALERMGRYQEALEALQQHVGMKDSLNEISSREQLNELNKKFEVNELKMQAERDKMKAERRQLYLLIAIVAVVLVAIIIIILARLHAARRLAKVNAQKERMEGELNIARDIQMSMVPGTFPTLPGLDMYASMTPAKEVGGDLYDYVLDGDTLYFALGDVSGKGVPASLFMVQATRLFTTMAHQGMEPAAICNRLNRELSGEDNANGMFVTMFIGKLDLKTGHLRFCNAGHNPPVLKPQSSNLNPQISNLNPQISNLNPQFIKMLPNAPIGLWPGLDYEGEEIESIKGCTLFLYTDGLNEAENRQQQQFGDERLLDVLRSTHFDAARQVVETLQAEVEQHRNGAEPNDDLTMMCIRLY